MGWKACLISKLLLNAVVIRLTKIFIIVKRTMTAVAMMMVMMILRIMLIMITSGNMK